MSRFLTPNLQQVFEHINFNDLFKYFKKKIIFSLLQSDFILEDLCVQHFTSITHDIYKAFDCSPSFEVQGVFLDISKAFDKVWYDGLLCKRKRNSINGDLLKFIERFLSDRYKRAVLNEQTSKWNKIKTEIPQGSILGLLFFLIY